MKSVYALIPAALLAGTVLSASVEAKRVEDPTVHAERLNAKQKYFKSMATRKPGTIKRVGSLQARKTVSDAKSARKTASDAKSARRTVSDVKLVRKTVSDAKSASVTRKLRKAATTKLRRQIAAAPAKQPTVNTLKMAHLAAIPVTVKTRKNLAVAVPKQIENEARKPVRLAWARLTKVPRSGPREAKRLVPAAKTTISEHGLRVIETGDMQVVEVIREMAPSYGVPTWFALRIANVESGYNPYARGRAGEIGIYQLKCQTARGMGFEGDCSGLTDVRTNVRWGLKHLSLAIESSGGNLRLAASKHNGGLGRKSLVDSYIAKVF